MRGPKRERAPLLELTYNWDKEDYGSGRNSGHLAFEVDDIYAFCQRLGDAGVTINRPPRDGHMAFIRSPDNISIEILEKGSALRSASPGAECKHRNVVSWGWGAGSRTGVVPAPWPRRPGGGHSP